MRQPYPSPFLSPVVWPLGHADMLEKSWIISPMAEAAFFGCGSAPCRWGIPEKNPLETGTSFYWSPEAQGNRWELA